MTSLATTAVLAFIQSITEFLPISSSGHLVLAETLGHSLNLPKQSLAFDVSLHVGTLVAVIVYFWKDVHRMIESVIYGYKNKRMLCNLLVATVPALIAGGCFIEILIRFRTPLVIAFTSIFYGVVLWVIDKWSPSRHQLEQMSWIEALCVGVAQALSLVPGTSRSGITMTCCRAFGFHRADSAKFSMLLSVPVISAAALYILYQMHQGHILSTFYDIHLLSGIGISAVSGLLVIWFLMSWLRQASFAVFALYRVLLGVSILYYYFL